MKTVKAISVIFILIASLCIYSACEKYVIVPSDYESYSLSVQPIFNSDCNNCHSSEDPVLTEDVSYNALLDGGYVNTSDPESSSLYTKLLSGPHASRTSDGNKAIILTWIEAGAPND